MRLNTEICRRIVLMLTLVMGISAAMPLAGSAKPSGEGPGNSANAGLCQKGGWQNLAPLETPWVPFGNQGECVSYGAHGNTIVDRFVDGRCEGDSFYDWRTTDRGRFGASDECYAYLYGGGTLAEPTPNAVINVVSVTETSCTVQGLFRDFPVGSYFLFRVVWPDGNGEWPGGAGAPYGDSSTSNFSLDPGESFTINVTYSPYFGSQVDASYTCEAPAA